MDTLTSLSNITGGLGDFAEAGKLASLATAYKAQAGLLDVAAQGEIAAGDLSAQQIKIQGDKIVARMKSAYAKAGVKFVGSPASVYAEQERNVQLSVVNEKLNAASRANEIGFQALQARIAAGNEKTQAWLKGTEGVLKVGMAFASSAPKDMGGGGTSQYGNEYGSNTPKGVYDKGTYSSLPRR